MGQQEISRWQKFYSDDPKLGDIPPSACAKQAARIFAEKSDSFILDLGCGTGRDTFYLADSCARVVGLDAARSGLLLAQKRAAGLQFRMAWIESDARYLPFLEALFDGVYCFGVLHEFVGDSAEVAVRMIMDEIYRVLKPSGIAVVTAAAGDPEKGLPHVQNFTEAMFDVATAKFHCIEKKLYDDLGCTGRTDYKVWFGHFVKR